MVGISLVCLRGVPAEGEGKWLKPPPKEEKSLTLTPKLSCFCCLFLAGMLANVRGGKRITADVI